MVTPAEETGRQVRRPGETVVRLVLCVLLLALGAHAWQQPVERPLGALLTGLQAGSVERVEVEVPPAGTSGTGFDIRWSTGLWSTGLWATGLLRTDLSRYDISGGDSQRQQVLTAAARSPRHVVVTTTAVRGFRGNTDGRWGLLGFGTVLAVLALLLAAAGRHWLPGLSGLLWSRSSG